VLTTLLIYIYRKSEREKSFKRTMYYSNLFILLLVALSLLSTIVSSQTTTQVCDKLRKCLHGGKCENGFVEGTGESISVCNCHTAIDDEGTKYTGLYCQHEVPVPHSLEEMIKDPRVCNSNGAFCLHDGKCKDDAELADPSICTCTDKYTGVHCEIEKDHELIQQLSGGTGICNLECENGGKCQFGIKEIDYSFETQVQKGDHLYQHCLCSKGFKGENCGIYEEELTMDSKCGDDHCHHGGICSSTKNGYEMCDCSATNKIASNVAFAGRYCEVTSTSICNGGSKKQGVNGKQFCTNYGTCVDPKNNGIYSCDCPNGYTGDHCEFPPTQKTVAAIKRATTCTKTVCQNGGRCQFGETKDHGLLHTMDNPDSLSHLVAPTSSDNEHCVCPEGYAGTNCEHQAVVCPHKKKICFHGSTCVRDEDEDWGYSCSCNNNKQNSVGNYNYNNNYETVDDDGLGDDEVDVFENYYQGPGNPNGKNPIDDDEDRRSLQQGAGQSGSPFEGQVNLGGDYCQYKATSKCSTGQTCFNKGDCYEDRCLCQDGFKGPFCEYTKNDVLVSKNNHKNNKSQHAHKRSKHHNTIIFFSFSLAFLGISLVLLVVAYTRVKIENTTGGSDMTAALTTNIKSNRTEQDVAATYLPFPSNNNSTMLMNNIDSSGSTHSGSMNPEEEKTVMELI